MQCLCVHTYFSNNIKLGSICYNWAVDNNIKQNIRTLQNCCTGLLLYVSCYIDVCA